MKGALIDSSARHRADGGRPRMRRLEPHLFVDLQKKRVAKIQSEPPRLKGLAQAEKDVSLGNLTKKGPPLKKPKFESTKAPIPEPLKVEVQPRPKSPFGLKKGKPSAQRPQSTKVTREEFVEKINEEPTPSNVNNLVKERDRKSVV